MQRNLLPRLPKYLLAVHNVAKLQNRQILRAVQSAENAPRLSEAMRVRPSALGPALPRAHLHLQALVKNCSF